MCSPLTLVKAPPTPNSSSDMRSQWHDGTVVGIYEASLPPDFPNRSDFLPPSQVDSQVVVPLVPYKCGNNQKNRSMKDPILFNTNGSPGVKLSAALGGDFKGIDGRDDFPLGEKKSGITIRINVGS